MSVVGRLERSITSFAFGPFADGVSEPRYKIEGHPPSLTRDLYFGIYQTLWSPDEHGTRLFEKFSRDFFDLIIIDECHRSGFGTWREILDHFGSAIHLGMTATPKQDENIDTYGYFCAEEYEVAIDPDRPKKGTWRPPAYQYSLGRGIEDGFLATYRVHRVRTNVDVTGLRLEVMERLHPPTTPSRETADRGAPGGGPREARNSAGSPRNRTASP